MGGATTNWVPDILGPGYQQLTMDLGPDPDGEGTAYATLVRFRPGEGFGDDFGDDADEYDASDRPAVLFVHGFTDYFFHRHIAEFFDGLGFAFYALDLRKSGRSRRPEQTAHYVTDLALYDAELDRALELVRAGSNGSVLLTAHSTGGLILPLWLDRRHKDGRDEGVAGLLLNSPWFDLQGPPLVRSRFVNGVIDLIGRVRPKLRIPMPMGDAYGASLSAAAHGEWDYELAFKPIDSFPVTFGWIRAVRRGQWALHKGLDVGVPSLLLRSNVSRAMRHYGPGADDADLVLDTKQIARWSGCLGNRNEAIPIPGARHDVFLSRTEPREAALREVETWIATLQSMNRFAGLRRAE